MNIIPLRVALAQINVTVGDLEGNTQKILASMRQAHEAGAHIVCVPELALPGYPPEDLLLKPGFVAANLHKLDELVDTSRDLPGLTSVIGFVDRDHDIYNAVAIIHEGKLYGIYHKHFLPNYGVFDENRYFQAGHKAPVFLINGVHVGVNICEDVWYPTGPMTLHAYAGAAGILSINGSPYYAWKLIFRNEMLATRGYVNKTDCRKAILGLSGGIDSSLTAAIAVDALGAENVLGISMPSGYSSAGSRSDAQELAENLGIQFLTIPIEETFRTALKMMQPALGEGDSGLAAENLQARIRGNILMTISNKSGAIVLTTGNKSEMAVGYTTLYGDMAGGFAVLKDVLKTLVYKLAVYRNSLGEKPVLPHTAIQKTPSPTLRPRQDDTR